MKILRILLAGIFVVAGLLYLNSIIPAPQKSQAITQSQFNGNLAQEWSGIPDGQGGTFLMHIGGEESPSCSSQIVNNLSSYTGGFNMFTRNTSKTIHVRIASQSYFCSTSDQLADGSNGHKCKVNPQGLQTFTHDLTPNEYFQWAPNAVNMNSCGMAQWDMSFQILDNSGNVVYTAGDMNQPGVTDQAYWTFCFAGNNGQKNWCSTPTPTPTVVTPTPTTPVTPTPTPGLDCDGDRDNSNPNTDSDCLPEGHLIVKKHVINDNGGTESAGDFTLYVRDVHTQSDISFPGSERGKSILISPTQLYTVYEGDHAGYDQTFLGDCSGMVARGQTKTCTIVNNDIPGVTPTPTPVCTTPTTCQTPPEGCFYQNQSTCSCGQLVCITQIPGCSGSNCNVTVTINNSNNQSQTQNQQQQQQQEQNMQAVLGASVAPASNASSLPSTGAGADVLLGLFGLIPLGLKLRKFV